MQKDPSFYTVSVAYGKTFHSFLCTASCKSAAMEKAADFIRENPKAQARVHLCNGELNWFMDTVEGLDGASILQLALTLAKGHRPTVVRRY